MTREGTLSPHNVKCSPIPPSDFEAWKAASVRRYASGKVRAGTWKEEEALSLAEKEYLQVLPEGMLTSDHQFSLLEDATSGEEVGSIWFQLVRARSLPLVQLWDILIDEEHRGQGYGVAAMRTLESESRRLGANKVSLGVFSYNLPAITLYEKMGYTASAMLIDRSAVLMSKELG